MIGQSKLNRIMKLLFVLLFAAMTSMMYIGGTFNLWDFWNAGRVYDFPKSDLTKSSESWIYNEETHNYVIVCDDALNKYVLSGISDEWKYLYVTMSGLGNSELETYVCYYNSENEKMQEQWFQLVDGDNVIALEYDIPIKRIGLRIRNGTGISFTIKSMQIREKINKFTWKIFLEAYGISALIGIIIISFLGIGRRKAIFCGAKECGIIEVIQFGYQLFGNHFGKKIGGKLYASQARNLRQFLFSLLFSWMVIINATGWLQNSKTSRYSLLVINLLMLLVALVSWERPLMKLEWDNVLSKTWFALWLVMCISDFFVTKQIRFVGYVMVISGGFFIFVWNQMNKPFYVIKDIRRSLEITFWIGLAFCMIFRTKWSFIGYNGIFPNQREAGIYAAFMFTVFGSELDEQLKKKIDYKLYLRCLIGIGLSGFLLIRSEDSVSIGIGITLLLFIGFRQCLKIKYWYKQWKGLLIITLLGIFLLSGMSFLVNTAMKKLPGLLNMDIVYKSEEKLSGVTQQQQELIRMIEPGSMENTGLKENTEVSTIQKNYIRRLNLFGNKRNVEVFRKEVPAYSGYVEIGYRYGIWILFPYILFQICVLTHSGERHAAEFWIKLTAIEFVTLCFGRNVELYWSHPLWLCFYLLPGYWFIHTDNTKSSNIC